MFINKWDKASKNIKWRKLTIYKKGRCNNMNTTVERYCTITQSLEESLKEMKAMREGKLPKKTWREYREEKRKATRETE